MNLFFSHENRGKTTAIVAIHTTRVIYYTHFVIKCLILICNYINAVMHIIYRLISFILYKNVHDDLRRKLLYIVLTICTYTCIGTHTHIYIYIRALVLRVSVCVGIEKSRGGGGWNIRIMPCEYIYV